MSERLVIAGFGGQGIMFLGKLIAWCAMREGKFVTFMPAYGAEVRGGTSHCSIIISDKEIASPCIDEISTLIVLNKPSFLKFFPNVRKGACVFANTSLIETLPVPPKGVEIFAFPFTDLAGKLGNARAANMVVLGAYLARNKILKVEDILKLLPEAFKNNTELIRLNESAVWEGVKLVSKDKKGVIKK